MRCAVLLLMLLSPAARAGGALHSQSVRVNGATHVRYIELRPFVHDSLSVALAPGEGMLRQTADGRVLRCIPGDQYCYDVRPGVRVSTVPVIHDIELSAWGFGRGASAFAQSRARNAFGGSALWPRGDDAFDVLAAYVELARERGRVRIGRQWKVSGLGFYNFDGVSLEARPAPMLSIEAYAGRSLMRGLNEPRTGAALESIEGMAPPEEGRLAGIQLRYQRTRSLAVGAVYQVDFRNDGRGLYAELFAVDAAMQWSSVAIESAIEVDVASAALNEARLRIRPGALGPVALHGELRHYQPYFELWTIWGAFSPVGFDEARLSAAWSESSGSVIVQSDLVYRSYGTTETEDAFALFRRGGWGAGASVAWFPRRVWRVDAGYRVETGAGAARRDAQAGVSRNFGERATISLQAAAFERLYEFRLSEGTVVGLGAEATLQVSERTRIVAGATTYRHFDAPSTSDWNQRRASVRAQWTVGPEPGQARVASQ